MTKPLRLMSWNLLEGGHVPAKEKPSRPTVDPVKMEAAVALVRRLAPDVLVINEALWCQPYDGYHVDYAAIFGFEHVCAKLYDGCWGNAILSRTPISTCKTFGIYNRGGLMAHLQTAQGDLQVATYHPHPSRWPAHKARDYRELVECGDPSLPLLVCGDFNAISPEDAPDGQALAEAFGAFSKQPQVDSARFIDGGQSVFPTLAGLGLRDAIGPAGRRRSMPTRLGGSDPNSGMRIDHAWINAHIDIFDAQVVHCEEADVASDHYPLLVDLDLRQSHR